MIFKSAAIAGAGANNKLATIITDESCTGTCETSFLQVRASALLDDKSDDSELRTSEEICKKQSTTGWYSGQYEKTLWPANAPAGRWTWQACAARCAIEDSCQFWTLQLSGESKCLLMSNRGEYHDEVGHMTGKRDPNCKALAAHSDSIPQEVCGVEPFDKLEAKAMEKAGIHLYMTHRDGANAPWNPAVDKCHRSSSWFGWSEGDDVGTLHAFLRGEGQATVEFSNCWNEGSVNLYVDGHKVASASAGQEQSAQFKFGHGSIMEMKDEHGNAVMQLNRLAFHCAKKPAKHVQILGLFDTGTNLLEEMVKDNFPSLHLETVNESTPFIWKHTLSGAKAIYKAISKNLPSTSSPEDVVVLAMVRSPIASIVSLKKAPYSLMACTDKTYAEMGKPCIGYVNDTDHTRGPWYNETVHRASHIYDVPDKARYHAEQFNATMQVYNDYVNQYKELKKLSAFKDVLIIPYEDLVLHPDKIMHEVAQVIGQDAPAQIQVATTSAKDHGESVDRNQALAKLKGRDWLKEFHNDPDGLFALCKYLNRSLVKDIVEGFYLDNRSLQVPYTYDCDNIWSVTLGDDA